MDIHKPRDLVNELRKSLWVGKVNRLRADRSFDPWVSTFHPDRLPCRLEGGFLNGSYNLGQKFVFNDGTAWLLRFPMVGTNADEYLDEKVAMEVEVLALLREKTTIPVPDVKAWGLAADNPLGLGPFIIMNFIEGVSLSRFLRAKEESRFLRKDISDDYIKRIHREVARIHLQLFQLDFDRIGSLPTPKTGFPAPIRPLTIKVHDILHTGGVNTFGAPQRPLSPIIWLRHTDTNQLIGDRSKGFETTTEYFQHLHEQQWEQVDQQPNSVYGRYTAQAEYADSQVLKSMIPHFVEPDYDQGPFKLVCDDLGMPNVLFRSEEDLTPVGVVDWEWSYVGPAQLAGSAPWWLLQARAIDWDTAEDDETVDEATSRFLRNLEMYKSVLEEEEKKMLPGGETPLSDLVKRSQASGSMWLHMVLTYGFTNFSSAPYVALRRHVGEDKWCQLQSALVRTDEKEAFGIRKAAEWEQYWEDSEQAEADMAAVDRHEMTEEEFLAKWAR